MTENESQAIVPSASELPLSGALVAIKPIAGYRKSRATLVNEKGPSILQLLLEGHSLIGACALCGVGARTVRDWIEKGTESDEREAHTDYAPFADGYRAVMAVVERELLACIETAAKGGTINTHKPNWEAAKYLLQVKFPRTYKETETPIEGTPSRIVVIEATIANEGVLGRTAYAEGHDEGVCLDVQEGGGGGHG